MDPAIDDDPVEKQLEDIMDRTTVGGASTVDDLETLGDMEMEAAEELDEAATMGAAAPPPAPGGGGPPRRRCDVCEEDLPESSFPQKNGKAIGNQCVEDFKALQSYQKQLKKVWGKDYAKKYSELKSNRSIWRSQVPPLPPCPSP